MERRSFLKAAGLAAALPALPATAAVPAAANEWKPADGTTGFLAVGSGPARLNIREFGAKGDGAAKDTAAIQRTLDRCAVLGGGVVTVPAGNYLTGALQLRSNTLLKLEEGATLSGSADIAEYPVTEVRWEGKWIAGHTALLYAIDAQKIGVHGPGKIAGNPAVGGRPQRGVAEGEGSYRHPALIEFIRCEWVHLKDFSTSYQRMWNVHPTCCTNVLIEGLNIRSNTGNGDGIDVDSCKHVRIERCDILTGDDCISLKSGRGEEGYTLLQTTEDVSIADCTFGDNIFACIGIGSETSGGVRGVKIDRCKFTLTGKGTAAVYLKTRPGRGAFLEDISANDLEIGAGCVSFLRFNFTGSGLQDEFPVPDPEGIPTIRNLRFTNIKVNGVQELIKGVDADTRKPVDGLVLENISGTCAKGISLANAKNVVVKNVTVSGFAGPLLSIANVTGKGLDGATKIDAPKTPDAVVAKEKYELK